MFEIPSILLYALVTGIFITVVLLHIMKKSSSAIYVYMIQSIAVVTMLVLFSLDHLSPLLLLAVVATISVKVIAAPYFFFGLVKKYRLIFLADTVFSVPVTLIILTALVAFTRMKIFAQLATLSSAGPDILFMSFAIVLMSIFLIINRRGAGSQMIGVLSLENGIVLFALLAGLEQNSAFQLGITINILMWVIISTVLASIMVRHFQSLDTSAMKELTE